MSYHMPRLHPDDLEEIKTHIASELIKEQQRLHLEELASKNNATYTVKEAAVVLNGLPPSTIARSCKKGIINAKKLGKSWAIPQESINP